MRKYTAAISVLFLLACLPRATFAQEAPLPACHYSFQAYTAKDGLSQSLTHSIAQDHQGNIWVSGREGINRFDGLSFENHLNNPRFPDQIFSHIYCDEQGRVWTLSNWNLYRFSGDTVQQFPIPQAEESPAVSLFPYRSDSLFILAKSPGKKVRLLLCHQDTIQESSISMDLPPLFNANDLHFLSQNELLVAAVHSETGAASLFKINAQGVASLLNWKGQTSFQRINLSAFEHKVVVRLDETLFFYQNQQFVPFAHIPMAFDKYLLKAPDHIYLTTQRGLYEYRQEQLTDFGLRWNSVTNIFLDREDRLWVAAEEGLFKLKNEAILHFPVERGMLPYTWTILEDADRNMWFASFHQGITRMDVRQRFYRPSLSEQAVIGAKPSFYTGGIVRFNGDLLFNMHGKVLAYNPRQKFFPLPGTVALTPSRAYQDIKQHDSTLYLATKGLLILHPDERTEFWSTGQGLDLTRLLYLESVELDTAHTVWMGSHYGLATLDLRTHAIHHYYVGEDIPAGINHIRRDDRGNLWFGSHKGLLLYRYQSALPEPVLPHRIQESVKFIRQIDTTWLMLGMLDRILLLHLPRFYAGETKLLSIDDETGFDGVDCIQASGYVDSNGHVWVATRTGVMKIIPEKLDAAIPKLQAFITHAETTPPQGEQWMGQPLQDQILQVESTDQVQIHFKVITHYKPRKVRYQYRLLGYNDNWSLESPLRYAYFANLPFGKYTFEVRPCLEGTCYETVQLPVRVIAAKNADHPIFQWSMLGVIILLIGAIAYIWFRENKEKQLAEKLQKELTQRELAQLRLQQQLLLSQTEPHFIFNSLNAIVGLIATKSKEKAIEYLSRFSELFRKVLANDPRDALPLREELAFVEDYLELEKLRFGNRFDFHVAVEENVNLQALIPRMLIQLFAHNAIKHGLESKKSHGGLLQISLKSQPPFILISIIDNGVGRKAAQLHSQPGAGAGMPIAQASIDWFNQQYPIASTFSITDLYDEDQHPCGTQVEIKLFDPNQNPPHENV